MASIYVITNDVNGKQYVGKTFLTLEERFEEHLRDSKTKSREKRPLYAAIKKYGEKHFSIRALEENIDPEILSEREIFWIRELGTFTDGYNATIGGDGNQLYDYKIIRDLLLSGLSVREVSNKVGCSMNTVRRVRKISNLKSGYDVLKKPVDQLGLEGNLLRTFDGIADAGRWLYNNGYSRSKYFGVLVRECINCRDQTAYGFKWRYHNESDRPSH